MEQKVISQPPAKMTATMPPIPAAITQGLAVLTTTVISDVRSTLHKTVQHHEPTPIWDVKFSKLELWGQRAIVSIVTKEKSAAPAYRQTIFYQRTDAGWVRMEPDATQWGAEYTLETPNFVYHFRQNDEQTVATVAPPIDALYVTMQRNFGLPISPDREKLMIDVSVLQPPGDALSSFTASKRFRVPSPARYLAPVAISDADLLAQSIALPLLTYVRAQATNLLRSCPVARLMIH